MDYNEIQHKQRMFEFAKSVHDTSIRDGLTDDEALEMANSMCAAHESDLRLLPHE